METVTCALLITTPSKKILLVHPTNAKHVGGWSLPKGIRDEFETELEAALRECLEETGIRFTLERDEIRDLGLHKYVSGKNCHLFHVSTNGEIDCKSLSCSSTFTGRDGRELQEVDKHMSVGAREAAKFLNAKQMKILESIGELEWLFHD